jgi:very-short-patch-repair endonuclease
MPFSPEQLFCALAALAVLLSLRWLRNREPAFPYDPADALLTPAEKAFFAILQQAVGEDFNLFAKVRLADLVVVRRGLRSKFRMRAFNRICGKHIDFVLCDPDSYAVLAAIELDDRSHERRARRQRDIFIDGALTAAGIPVLHVAAQRRYSVAKLRDQVLTCLETSGPTFADRHG